MRGDFTAPSVRSDEERRERYKEYRKKEKERVGVRKRERERMIERRGRKAGNFSPLQLLALSRVRLERV
jgi:hypothetical protein